MTRNSGVSEQECYSYGIGTPEVQFVPNPSTRSNHRLLTPSDTASSFDHDDQATQETGNHHYEDPARLAQQALTNNSRGPRKKANDLYESMSMPLKTINNVKQRVRTLSRSSDDSATGYTYHGREPICHRLILYLVLLLSLTATVLVVLMIFGLVGPTCQCGSKQTSSEPSKGRSSQQQSFSLEPIKKTISELQANITKMEALLNEKKSDDNIQVPIVNGSVSVLDLQRHFDAKLNSTKDQLQAATGRIAEQMTAMNSSLISKIQAVSLVQGVQGLPGFNGSDGDSGRMGLQGLPGINGTRGPPGSGNFSQCQYKASTLHSHKQDKATSVSTNLVQPDGFIIIDASCSTVGTQEYNLEINVPVGGGNPNFICHCKGISTLFPSSDVNVYCTLHYLLCPKTT